jgi:hypothetical protein
MAAAAICAITAALLRHRTSAQALAGTTIALVLRQIAILRIR